MKEDSLYKELSFAFPGGLLEDWGNRKDGVHLLNCGDSQSNLSVPMSLVPFTSLGSLSDC